MPYKLPQKSTAESDAAIAMTTKQTTTLIETNNELMRSGQNLVKKYLD